MAYIGSWKIGDLVTFYANTHNASNGMAVNADAVPSYHVYEDETATPLVTGTMALLNNPNTIGFYSEQITLSAVNGFEKGKSYGVYIRAVVGGVTGTMSHYFQVEAEVDMNTASTPVTAGMVTGSVLGNVNGSVQSVTNPVTVGTNNDKTGYSLSSPQTYDRIGNTTGTITNVLNVVNPVTAGMVTGSVLGSVGSVVSPVGISTGTFLDALADKVWDEPIAGHLGAGSVGNALNAAGSAGDPWSTALPGSYTAGQAGHILASRMPTGTVIVGTNNDKTGYGLATGTLLEAIADKVWDEANSEHLIAGSVGHTLYSRMATGTVLVGDKTGFSLANPQAFDLIGNISGTITNTLNVVNPVVAGVVTGSVLGNVNGSVNSVTTPVGISTGTFILAIADQVWDEQLSGHLAAGSAGSSLNGAGSAGDPWTTALPGAYGAGTAGHILASRMPTGTVVVSSNQDKTGYSLSGGQNINITGTFVGNIQGNLSGSVGSVTDLGSTLLNKIADFILRRPLASARASSDGDAVTFRSLLGAASKLVNRWRIQGTTLTVYEEDDTTAFETQTLTGTAGADPITEVDTD